MNRSFLTSLLTMLALLNGCVCYRSHLVASFGEHSYTNVSEHNEINVWWDASNYSGSGINPFFMWEIEKQGYSKLTIGFIRQPKNDSEVVIESLSCTDKKGTPVKIKPFETNNNEIRLKFFELPVNLPFEEKTLPLFDRCEEGCCGGRDVLRNYTELLIHPDIKKKYPPYKIHLKGHYIKNNGSTEPIDAEIIMSVKRKRRLTSIAECWP